MRRLVMKFNERRVDETKRSWVDCMKAASFVDKCDCHPAVLPWKVCIGQGVVDVRRARSRIHIVSAFHGWRRSDPINCSSSYGERSVPSKVDEGVWTSALKIICSVAARLR